MAMIKIPIGPGPARELLKVVKAMHREVDGRLSRLEKLLEAAAKAKPRKTRRGR